MIQIRVQFIIPRKGMLSKIPSQDLLYMILIYICIHVVDPVLLVLNLTSVISMLSMLLGSYHV